MKTANLLDIAPVASMQVDVSKKLQEEAIEVTEIFASMMNQNLNVGNQLADDRSSNMSVSKTEGAQAITDSYERFSYKDNQIDAAKEQELSQEEMNAVEETLEAAEEEIVSAISEEYGVDEEDIHNLLNEMGLEVLDLLDPKNLVSFVVALTGVASGENLLLDESFLTIMETMEAVVDNLMNELNVDMNGLQEVISMMKTVEVDEDVENTFGQELDVQLEDSNVQNNQNAEEITSEDTVEVTEDGNSNVQVIVEESEASEVSTNETEVAEELKVQTNETDKTAEVKMDNEETKAVEATVETEPDETLSSNENYGKDSLLNQRNSNPDAAIVTNGQSIQQTVQVTDAVSTQFTTYLSVDTTQIMEQIAEQIKVVVTPDTTSMEMQLNPENLGKIYLNISSENGTVNAQFYATSEVVKEALELQIATLRENLTQAGVKVDAIEVTIASHEFEQNLEQNQEKPNQTNMEEEKAPKRRNLTVDTLDELQGVMTEEETLVAQIMRDNGNSVDYTA